MFGRLIKHTMYAVSGATFIGKRRELDAYISENVVDYRLKQNSREVFERQDESGYELTVSVQS
jgi:hypothetical protein